MASEYWKWKFKDVRPEEQVELTPEQKRRNWWHYHKWHVLVGIVLVAVGVNILMNVLGVGEVRPDYQFAYVGAVMPPDQAIEALERALAEMGEDCNGDGQVAVQLNVYATGGSDAASPYYGAAASTKVMADLEALDSYFFLLEDPAQFQLDYHVLRALDGSLPDDADANWEACCLKWTDCPALAALDLGEFEESVLNQSFGGSVQGVFSGLYIARRGFWTDVTSDHVDACDALWDRLTEGAIP